LAVHCRKQSQGRFTALRDNERQEGNGKFRNRAQSRKGTTRGVVCRGRKHGGGHRCATVDRWRRRKWKYFMVGSQGPPLEGKQEGVGGGKGKGLNSLSEKDATEVGEGARGRTNSLGGGHGTREKNARKATSGQKLTSDSGLTEKARAKIIKERRPGRNTKILGVTKTDNRLKGGRRDRSGERGERRGVSCGGQIGQ